MEFPIFKYLDNLLNLNSGYTKIQQQPSQTGGKKVTNVKKNKTVKPVSKKVVKKSTKKH